MRRCDEPIKGDCCVFCSYGDVRCPCMLDKGIGFVIWDNKPIPIFSVGTWLIVKFDVVFHLLSIARHKHTGDGSRIPAASSGGLGQARWSFWRVSPISLQ